MSTNLTNSSASRKPLRLWPGIAAAVLLVLIGGYAGLVIRRGRKVGSQLPQDERTWS